jgi:nucleoid DNA-binding protein
MALTKVIGESLSDGRIVRIDSLDSFQITVQESPGESPDELSKATIKGANIIYKPPKNMKKMLNGLIYKRTR